MNSDLKGKAPRRIFISHSAKDRALADAIRKSLEHAGISCWLASRDVPPGSHYSEVIVDAIENCQVFLVVLTENASDSPHVKKEFDLAISASKKILPFKFGQFQDNKSMRYFLSHVQFATQPARVTTEVLDAIVTQCRDQLHAQGVEIGQGDAGATPFTLKHPLRMGKTRWPGKILGMAVVMLLLLGLVNIFTAVTQEPPVFPNPASNREKNSVREMLAYLRTNLILLNNQFAAYGKAVEICESYLDNPSPARLEAAKSACEHARAVIDAQLSQTQDLPDALRSALAESPVDGGDLATVAVLPATIGAQLMNSLAFLPDIMNPDQLLDPAHRRKALRIDRQIQELTARSIFYGVCDLLRPVDEMALEEFRTQGITLLTAFSADELPWLRDRIEIRRRVDACAEKQKALLTELAGMVGEEGKGLEAQKILFQAAAEAAGLPPEDIRDELAHSERVAGKAQRVRDLEAKEERVNREYERLVAEVRQKFTAHADDPPGVIWGKTLRLLAVHEDATALANLQVLKSALVASDPKGSVYTEAAARFIRQRNATGIDYGVLVCGYADQPHPSLEIGDIVVAYNRSPVLNGDAFIKLKTRDAADSARLTILRGDQQGRLQTMTVPYDKNGPKVSLLNLTEREEL